MNRTYFVPVVGGVYQNRNGKSYLCMRVMEQKHPSDTMAVFKRQPDGWTLTAHGISKYEDGTVEWNYSTKGHWPKKVQEGKEGVFDAN